ncbi:MAG TPA: hypothetical protein VF257_07110 [Solirubrobacteraceae bacterium]
MAHELVELRVAAAHELTHFVVAGGGVGLELDEQQRAIGEHGAVGLLHRVEGAFLAGGCRGGAEGLLDAIEAALDGGQEETLLGPEEAEGVRLGDADRVGDRADRRAVQAGLRELLDGGVDECEVGGVFGASVVALGAVVALLLPRGKAAPATAAALPIGEPVAA